MRAYFFFLVILLPSLAFADMIPDYPPIQCPAGSYESMSHNGPYCAPSSCKADKDCQDGNVCQTQGLCVISTKRYGRGGDYIEKSVGDVCDEKKACSAGTCQIIKRCVSKGTKETPTTTPTDEPIVVKTPQPEPPKENPKTPEPESQPESTPTEAPKPPTKVEPKGRCSVSPAENFSASIAALFFAFFVVVRRRSLPR